jgi:hypothetical protein
VRVAYDLSPAWRLAGALSLLNNSNLDPSVRLDFASEVESASVYWVPDAGKWGNVLVEYARSAVR